MIKKISEGPLTVTVEPNLAVVTDGLCAAWSGIPYAQLSVTLMMLRFLAFVHQTNHWTAKGDPFYGDHLLFERLYNGVVGEIDTVAEKAVGLGGTENVNLQLQVTQLLQMVQGYGTVSMIPQSCDLAQRSLVVEMNFVKNLTDLMLSMEEQGILTRGLSNLLEGVLDVHEGHIY
jgi:hypothetical protein